MADETPVLIPKLAKTPLRPGGTNTSWVAAIGGQSFIVGYDGRAFIEGLEPQNRVTVALSSGECQAEFAYQANGRRQSLIGPVFCQ